MKGLPGPLSEPRVERLAAWHAEYLDGEFKLFINSPGTEIRAIVTVEIDLAKSAFAVHGVDETGKPALVRPVVKRVACSNRWPNSRGISSAGRVVFHHADSVRLPV